MSKSQTILWITSPEFDGQEQRLMQSLSGYEVETAKDIPNALDRLRTAPVDAAFANFPVRDWLPAELLEEVQRIDAHLPLFIRDCGGTMSDAVRLTKLGAHHFFGEAVDPDELLQNMEWAIEDRNGPPASADPWKQFLVGESRAIQQVSQIVRLIGKRRCTVLIHGETGTGKEVMARAIHSAGPRAAVPLVAINCSALPENLLEAELFGHVRGAFTGAQQHRTGRFEQAHNGTLFLDEIGDLPMELQAKLLRVLQEREFQRLGSSETIKVDVRVIAASNVDLAARVRSGTFREDLYYRLNVVPIEMPALRTRLSDVPILTQHFIRKICRAESLPAKKISREAIDRLCAYAWPGNVRQLENAIEMAIVLSGERAMLYPGDFPLPGPALGKHSEPARNSTIAVPDYGLDFAETVNHFERSILSQALRKTGGNKKMAADMLHLKRTTLAAKVKVLEPEAGWGLM
ncbi:MAG: sigma-54 dependent transcriptional regulator [Acidobacteriota bacterium]|nr:sigma-54 dependent transcriptional regulator [Acidobacteriota bacterium]